MIKSIRHKELRQLYEKDDSRGVNPEQTKRLKLMLQALEHAHKPDDLMSIATFRMHLLEPKPQGRLAITGRENWRVTFEFEQGDVILVDYEDYH